ncbi:MAG: T9SS type A sorting domain-containing protein [Patiriisocius sp.]|uniref:T9SS type A sorting domain-containing protein n=1 Tax=Patiriisocius sp. TaxID=2822396 RepID=UPI003EF86D66
MKKASTLFNNLFIFLLFLLTINSLSGQERIAVLQDPLVVLLDATNGSIVDPSFIDLTSLNPGRPKDILQVGDEIWITDQSNDRIDRFDLTGTYQSTIDTGLDNIKGLENVNGEVWVANAGTNNGAPGNSIVRFSTGGTNLGFFLTSGTAAVFDILNVGNNEVYLSYITGGAKIERRDYAGNVLGNIVEEGVLSFIQQLELNPTSNSIYAAEFIGTATNQEGLYEFDIATGAILNYYDEGSLRGVATLSDGNVLVSSAAGVRILNPGTGTSTVVNNTGSDYFGRLNLTPCVPPATPSGDAVQTFNDGATLADIIVTPSNVTWFPTEADALAGTNSLPLSTILVDQTTYYAVNIVDSCLSAPFEVTVNISLGLDNLENNQLIVYPNPAKNTLFVQNSSQIEEIEIYSITGKKVFEAKPKSNNTTIEVSSLTNGMYILTVISEGKRSQRKFLIAQ